MFRSSMLPSCVPIQLQVFEYYAFVSGKCKELRRRATSVSVVFPPCRQPTLQAIVATCLS